MQAKIGIWWDNGAKVVAFPESVGSADRITKLCDSDASHDERWAEAAPLLGIRPSMEYFSIPRGRVLYAPNRKTSIIYHGNRTSKARLIKIASAFHLSKWIARLDLHYMMDEAADQMFQDD